MEKEELILKLFAEGKTIPQVVKETGFSDWAVRNCAKKNNIEVKSRKTKITDEILEKIEELLDKGLTNKQIATELDMSPTTVRKYTTEYLHRETNSIKTKSINKKELELTQEQEEVLYGSLLGDMSLDINYKNARPVINQGGEQEEYFDHKCEIFKNILGKVSKKDRYDKRTDKYYHKYSAKLLAHPKFTEMHELLYPNGIKTVTKEWLDKITPRGLAFWFMDDGNNTGVLATNCFSYEECTLIKEWFLEKYNIETTIQNQKLKSGIQHLIYIRACSRADFYDLVSPYIIPSMEYKLHNWNP